MAFENADEEDPALSEDEFDSDGHGWLTGSDQGDSDDEAEREAERRADARRKAARDEHGVRMDDDASCAASACAVLAGATIARAPRPDSPVGT